MNTNKKFSELIIELTEVWLMWMKHNTISHDINVSNELRRKSAEQCEILINKEYLIVAQLDKFFEKTNG